MSYRTTLQLIATVITAIIMVAIYLGFDALFDRMSIDFALGFLAAMTLVVIVYHTSNWLDRSSPDAADRGQHQRPRHSIDL